MSQTETAGSPGGGRPAADKSLTLRLPLGDTSRNEYLYPVIGHMLVAAVVVAEKIGDNALVDELFRLKVWLDRRRRERDVTAEASAWLESLPDRRHWR